jgi:glycosyltransferase involved in cell wall biosynthesis
MRIIAALPAYNEAKYISCMIAEVKKYADEVLVLDDGSSDGTGALALVAGATVRSHDTNQGYGATIQSILVETRRMVFDVLVIIDADTQHFPEDIPELAKAILEGNDLAIGSRNHKDVSVFRNVGGTVLSFFTRILSGAKVADSQCGFRALSPKAAAMLDLHEPGMAISSEMVADAAKRHLKIIEVPVKIRYTKDSSTHNPIYQGFYTLAKVIMMIGKKAISR